MRLMLPGAGGKSGIDALTGRMACRRVMCTVHMRFVVNLLITDTIKYSCLQYGADRDLRLLTSFSGNDSP